MARIRSKRIPLWLTPADYAAARQADTDCYARYFREMLKRGIYLAPAQFEAMFVSTAHSEAEIDKTIEQAGQVLSKIKKEGL